MICGKCARGADLVKCADEEVLEEHARYLRERAADFHGQCQFPAGCTCQHRSRVVLTESVQPG